MSSLPTYLAGNWLRRLGLISVFWLTLTTFPVCSLAQNVQVTGSVTDTTGAAIAGAQITLRSSHSSSSTRANSHGEFTFSVDAHSSGTIQVTAEGFVPTEQQWTASSESVPLVFTLKTAAQSERIIVSASRSELKLSEVPGSAVQLSPTDLKANPGLTLDDLLRQVPGFSLFRRSSSRTANPGTQGVSLRGLGANGPSRALVLEDGIPMVDPFGGWVYWDRVPRVALSSVEVFRGGASSLYGSDALGGVVQFLTRVPTTPSLSIDTSYGSEDTPDLSTWAGAAFSRWDFAASTGMSRTEGYILIPASQRGPVDNKANSEHATVDAAVGYKVSDNGRLFLRGTFLDESRNNGTRIQKNSTGTGFGSAGFNTAIGAHDWISVRAFGQAQGYDQTFSSISSVTSPRDTETLTDIQHVPSQQAGTALQWNHVLKNHTLSAGLDFQEIVGASGDQLFSSKTGAHLSNVVAGGRQRFTGLFGQDIFRFNKWTVIASGRWDDWNNFHGSMFQTTIASGSSTLTNFADRTETAFSPRLALMRTLTSNLSLSLSGYRAFRAPTLSELYRTFRQGITVTSSNPQLRAERLTGAETSLRAIAFGKLESRATFFWGDVVDPITSVTLNTTPTLITRQRQNLGRTRSLGVELDGALHLSSVIEISAGYQYTHAYVESSTASLIGKLVPQVPYHQLTWEFRYWSPNRVMFSVQGRYSGAQYDDDLNALLLTRYYVMDVFVGRQFRRGLTAYLAAENLLNQRYPVTLTPPSPGIISQGPPILARVGLRYDFPTERK